MQRRIQGNRSLSASDGGCGCDGEGADSSGVCLESMAIALPEFDRETLAFVALQPLRTEAQQSQRSTLHTPMERSAACSRQTARCLLLDRITTKSAAEIRKAGFGHTGCPNSLSLEIIGAHSLSLIFILFGFLEEELRGWGRSGLCWEFPYPSHVAKGICNSG